jgi:hypothetical protein
LQEESIGRCYSIIGAAAMTAGGLPALAATTAKVGAGDDTGLLAFIPKSIKICKGDKVALTSGKPNLARSVRA